MSFYQIFKKIKHYLLFYNMSNEASPYFEKLLTLTIYSVLFTINKIK